MELERWLEMVLGQNTCAPFAVPGFEPGLPDSESGVLTTTLYRSKLPRVLGGLPKLFFTVLYQIKRA